jgi:hypothetical protein
MVDRSLHQQNRGSMFMRVFRAAAVITLLVGPAGTAYAQDQTPVPRYGDQKAKSPQQIEEEKQADKAYQKSLGNIPDKGPVDPWSNARSADTPQAATKAVQVKPKPKPPTKTGSSAN